MKKKIITATIIQDETALTLEEVCHTIAIDQDTLIEMIHYEIIFPQGDTLKNYTFDSLCLTRIKKALSFHQDLGLNYAGIALALELLERIENLEKELTLISPAKH